MSSSISLCSAHCNSLHLVPAEICSHNNDILLESFFLCSWPECLSIFHHVSANKNTKKANCRNVLSLCLIQGTVHLSWFWEREGRSPWLGLLPRSRWIASGPHQPHGLDTEETRRAPAPLAQHMMVCGPLWCGCGFRSPSSPSVGVWPGHQCGQHCHLKEQ